ncbi:MAG TPA: PAS domain S-box protein [Chthoniobacteraceae bacterium]|jgi:PAS domain S-box-containing protein|nr:PAS domain S-box protein [Chthoniobacteraceae bacterium]
MGQGTADEANQTPGSGVGRWEGKSRTEEYPVWLRYCAAILIIALATGARMYLYRQGLAGIPYLTYYPAVIFVALLFDAGPAILAILLSALAADYFWIPPAGSFAITSPVEQLAMGFFISVTLGMAWVCHSQRSAIWRMKRAEEALRSAHRAAIAGLLDKVGDGVAVLNRDWKYAYVNPAAAAILRMPAEALLGKVLWDIFPAVESLAAGREFRRCMRDGVPVRFDEFYPEPLNIWFEVRCYPCTEGVRIFFSDITERKTNEARLRQLSRAVEQCPVSIVITDPCGNIEYVNPRFSALTGYSAADVIGQNPRILKAGGVPAETYKDLWTTIKGGNEWKGRLRNKKKDGQLFWESASISPILGEGGAITHFVAVKEDITESLRAEQSRMECVRLEEANRRMEEENRMKREFLANMSHELRTPLNGIIGFTEVLLDSKPGPLNPKQSEYLGDVLTSGRHLLALINDILDLAKVEAGKMELHLSQFSLPRTLGEVRAVLQPVAEKQQVAVSTWAGPGLQDVFLDQQRLKQVLYNLLSNAIKFTDAGGSVSVLADLYGDDSFRIRVIDTGIGIRSEDMGKLFKEFQQIDTGSARRYEGSGLGLALTRSIIGLMHGAVTVDSDFGMGSTFTVILPLRLSNNTGRSGK